MGTICLSSTDVERNFIDAVSHIHAPPSHVIWWTPLNCYTNSNSNWTGKCIDPFKSMNFQSEAPFIILLQCKYHMNIKKKRKIRFDEKDQIWFFFFFFFFRIFAEPIEFDAMWQNRIGQNPGANQHARNARLSIVSIIKLWVKCEFNRSVRRT